MDRIDVWFRAAGTATAAAGITGFVWTAKYIVDHGVPAAGAGLLGTGDSRMLQGRWGGASGDVGESRQAQVSDRGLESSVELRRFVFGVSEADLEAFDFAEPPLLLGLGGSPSTAGESTRQNRVQEPSWP